MSDTTSVTQTKSWGSRLKSAAAGVIFGPILIIIGCIVLWTNEGRNARMLEALDEGRKSVVTLAADTIDPTHDGQLVHLSAPASTEETLLDPQTGLAMHALALERKVEAYQWRQKEESSSHNNMGGSQTTTTTYSYDKAWDDEYISSADFHTQSGHTNPTQWKYSAQQFHANKVRAGSFDLSSSLIAQIPAETSLNLQDAGLKAQSGEILSATTLYVGKDPANPEIGDLRVTYEITSSPSDISLIAKQSGHLLTDYRAKSGADITRVSLGTLSSDEMFAAMESENTILTWVLRLVGTLVIFVGAAWFLSILPMLAMVLPIMGSIVEFGTSLIALLFTAAAAGLTITLAWFAYRPVVSLIVATVSGIAIFGILRLIHQKKKQPEMMPPNISL